MGLNVEGDRIQETEVRIKKEKLLQEHIAYAYFSLRREDMPGVLATMKTIHILY
jgi:hypothetical protein